MTRDGDNQSGVALVFFALVLMLCVVVPAWYAARAGTVNGALLALAKFQLKVFVPFSAEAQKAWVYITGLDPADLTWEQTQNILRYTGKWIRWPFVLFLGLFAAASVFLGGRLSGLVRRLNMESLLRNNAESFACLGPIVGRGKELLDPDSYDAGLWRIARSPLQFAVEHGLLLDENGAAFAPEQVLRHGLGRADLPAYGRARLDEDKALVVLGEQLGPAFAGFPAFTPGRKALAAAFAAYAGGDKKESIGILDELSRAYTEKDGVQDCPVMTAEDFHARLVTVFTKHEAILSESLIVRHSAYELPWFTALLTRARRKGVLAPSQYLWLRPLDRTLWYALHQCGGRAAWAEGVAAWAHYAAEEKAGNALSEPHVKQAVVALRDALAAQGWLTDNAVSANTAVAADADVVSGNAAPAPKPVMQGNADGDTEADADMVYAPAEDDLEYDPEYDANTDPALTRESF
ncbi:MAG: hypothetical protein LBR82_11190 [Desulfovibrio sp.]|jgi:hypothetical protein|nr:hypothetical protein [Desulfovibrio sp.]